MSRLDQIYRSLLLTKFFTKGWGNPANLKRLFEFRKVLSCRESCQKLVPLDYPVQIDQDRTYREERIIEGQFVSPLTLHLPNIMPKESEIARFQMILPKNWNTRLKPVCIHLAGTGDHYFWRRRTFLARPLLKEAGIASILLENPYYGVRKPKQQIRSSLHNVSDLFVMGGALVLESIVLLRWCEQQGFGPLGMTGISMGGHMSSVAVANWHKPISHVPIMSGCTASYTFTQGVLSGAIPWQLLQEQYFADSSFEQEVAKLIESPELGRSDGMFNFGRDFVRNYPASVSDMEKLQGELRSQSTLLSERRARAEHEGEDHVTSSMSLGSAMPSNPSPNLGSNVSSPRGVRFHMTSTSDSSGSTFNFFSNAFGLKHRFRASREPDGDGARERRQREALLFMRGVMDECTHLGNFSKPVDTGLVIIVAARSDAYVPRKSVLSLEELWPGAEVRYVDTGHITAFLFKQAFFRKAIVDAFDRQISKYYRS